MRIRAAELGAFARDIAFPKTERVLSRSAHAAALEQRVMLSATIMVDTVTDVVDSNDGLTSLREAVNQASTGDVIQLTAGTYVLDEDAGASDELRGDLDITRDLTIIGSDASTTIIDASGLATADRVLEIHGGATLNLSEVTIQNGDAGVDRGGGILVDGTLNAYRVVVTNNRAFQGAGVYQATGNANLFEFVLSQNVATGDGGGFYLETGDGKLEGGAISDNTADRGAGVFQLADSLGISNVSIFQNVATSGGGGIWTSGTVTSVHNTIAFNDGNNGVGLADTAGLERSGAGGGTLTNTILHNPLGRNADAGFTDGGGNLVSDTSGGFGASSDPLLAVAADNGGFSQTLAIDPNSPAFNGGLATGGATSDQRGTARGDGVPDIGAFEFQSTILTPVSERRANTTTADRQVTRGEDLASDRGGHRAVALDVYGNSIVVWSDAMADGDGWGVFGQRFDVNGNPLGSEFQVNSVSLGDQYDATVDVDALGRFVVAFTGDDSDGTGVFLRRFAADGTPIDLVDVHVNPSQLGNQQNGSVAVNASGDLVIAWENEGSGIFAKSFDMTSLAPGNQLPAALITVDTNAAAEFPSVDINDSGRFVVAFADSGSIYGRRYDFGSTVALSARHQINIAAGNDYDVTIAVQPEGDFVAAYRSDDFLANGIWTRRFQTDGTPHAGPTRASGTTAVSPSIASGAGGDYIIVYQDADADGLGVFARKFFADRQALGAQIQINESTVLDQRWASVAVNDLNNFVVAWSGAGELAGQVDTEGVFVRQFGGPNQAPTLTILTAPVDTTDEDTEVEITFNELRSAGDEADADGVAEAFVVTGIVGGELRLGASAATATAWAPGFQDTIDATTNAYWTPGTNANGLLDAFQVVVRDDDGTDSTTPVTVSVDVLPVDDPVSVANPIPDQTVTARTPFSFQFASDAFVDPDGDTLTFSATLDGGSTLPPWLNFDAATRTFSGTPSNLDVGTIDVLVVADDGNSGPATDVFSISVASNGVIVDARSTGTTPDQPILTISHTTSGADRLMLVGVATDPHGDSVASITYNGANLFFVGAEEGAGTHSRVEIWGLIAPDLGTADVIVNLTGTNHKGVAVGVTTFNNVDQVDPLGAFASSFGASTTATLSSTSAPDELVFAVVHSHNGTDAVQGSGQFELWDLVADQSNGSGTVQVGAATVTSSWTVNNDDWTIGAIAVQSNLGSPPTVSVPLADQTATEDLPFTFQFPANTFDDVDGDALTYTATRDDSSPLPAWLSFDSVTRTFTGTPANSDVGLVTVRVIASDGNGGTVFDDFQLTVVNTNDAPVIVNPLVDQTATEDSAFTFQFPTATFDDEDGDALTYTATLDDNSPLPAWLSFDTVTRTFTGTPANPDVGLVTVRVIASDGNGGTVFDDFQLTVANTNDAPVIVNPLVDQTATEDSVFTFQFPTATFDDEDGDALTYTATLDDNSPLPTWLSFDSVTRTFTGTPANPDVGLVTVRVTADDGNGGTVFDEFQLTVANTNDAPVVINPIVDQTAMEDSPFNFQFPVNTFDDVDGDALTYNATLDDNSPLPTWLSFDAITRTFTGTPANSDVGFVTVRVTATDGNSGTVSDDFQLTVVNTNDAPVVTNPLVDQTATENLPFTYQFPIATFDDEDGDTLTYTATLDDSSPLPTWLNFDNVTRTFSGTPTDLDVGVVTVRLTVDDGNGGTTFDDFLLTTVSVNDPPTDITPNSFSIDEHLDTSGGIRLGTLSAVDSDPGETFTWSIVPGGDSDRFSVSGAGLDELWIDDGVLNFESKPSYSVDVRVTDSAANALVEAIVVTVNDINEPPVARNDAFTITSSSYASEASGVLVNDADPDGDTLTASIVGLPQDGTLTLLPNGTFLYTPDFGFSGVDSFTYELSDGVTASVQAQVELTVIAAVPAPATTPEASPNTIRPSETTPGDDVTVPMLMPPSVLTPESPSVEPRERLDLDTVGTPPPQDATVVTIDSGDSETTPTDERLFWASRSVGALGRLPSSGANAVASLGSPILSTSTFVGLFQEFDDLRRETLRDVYFTRATLSTSLAATTSMSVGYVIWMIRGGVLMSSLLSSLPAWRVVDPLPVLGYLEDERDPESDESLDRMVSRSNRAVEEKP